jgi:hypothetical protein
MIKYILKPKQTELKSLAKKYFEFDYSDKDVLKDKARNFVNENGYLNKKTFYEVCRWKSTRQTKRYQENNESDIKEITKFAFSTKSERLRIESLIILSGVQYPTASALLHICFKNKYPILDFRALWSLSVDISKVIVNYELWSTYCSYCKITSEKYGLDLEAFDQALWTYSKLHQKK